MFLNRLSIALSYYSTLDITNSPKDVDSFIQFVTTIYHHLIDDYIHMVKIHGHQIKDIKDTLLDQDSFNVFDIKQCLFTARHHRVDIEKQNEDIKDNGTFDAYKDVMDSLHYFIFHVIDI